MITTDSLLGRFLGINRWRIFFSALGRESAADCRPPLESGAVFLALIVCSFPVVFAALEAENGSPSLNSTIAFGVCTLLALLIRSWLKLELIPVRSWRESISITHTAAALGCIPAIAIILLNPSLLSARHDALTNAVSPAAAGPSRGLALSLAMVAASALWISVTEEYLFRGLLVSVIRRWRLIKSQAGRDIAAVIISAGLFGAAHYPTWGAGASMALAGLGVGFVLGYIANGERLLPVILYHFIFDALSITIAVMT